MSELEVLDNIFDYCFVSTAATYTWRQTLTVYILRVKCIYYFIYRVMYIFLFFRAAVVDVDLLYEVFSSYTDTPLSL